MDTEFHTKYLDKFIGEKNRKANLLNILNYLVATKNCKAKLKDNYGSEIEKQKKIRLVAISI